MNHEPSLKVAKLKSYISGFQPGEYLAYNRIEVDTGLKMDYEGRSFLRRALHQLKCPYDTKRGEGVELASAGNSERIIAGRLSRVSSAVKTASTTHKQLADKFIMEMDENTRKRVLFVGSVLGAIDAASKQYIAAFSPKMRNAAMPLLPEGVTP